MAKRSSRSRNLSRFSSEARAERTGMRQAVAPILQVDLATQYRYVMRDLMHIGVIAALLIGSLIALSFYFK